MNQTYRIENGNFPLYGILSGNIKNNQGVIFCHGLGSNRIGYNYLFKELATSLSVNYWVYRFDFIGHGEDLRSFNELSFKEMCSELEQVIYHFCNINSNAQISFVAQGLGATVLNNTLNYANVKQLHKIIFINPTMHIYKLSETTEKKLESNGSIDLALINDEDKIFLKDLGMEVSCIGGLILTNSLYKELLTLKNNLKSSICILDPINYESNRLLFDECEEILVIKKSNYIFEAFENRNQILSKIGALLNK